MEKFWMKAVSVTGPIAVVGFLFAILMENLFKKRIIEYFGSNRVFYLVVTILCFLGTALILAIMRYKGSQNDVGEGEQTSKPNRETKTANIKNSKINGDIVFGDKNINQGGKSDQ